MMNQSNPPRIRNALTIDLEEWFHVCDDDNPNPEALWSSHESRVVRDTEITLDLLAQYRVRGTFFVLGYVAERFPELIREIDSEGHRIASHGHLHRRINRMTPQEFESDLARSIDTLADITGKPVLGFRAPEWSLRRHTQWAFSILARHGIRYDSSAVRLARMGDRCWTTRIEQIHTLYGDIIEFPLSTVRIFWENLPFSGGFAQRFFPFWYILENFHELNRRGIPGVIYFHPWELTAHKGDLPMSPSRRLMHYYRLRSVREKVEALLDALALAPMEEVLFGREFSASSRYLSTDRPQTGESSILVRS